MQWLQDCLDQTFLAQMFGWEYTVGQPTIIFLGINKGNALRSHLI